MQKKGRRFEWLDEHTESVRKLKEALAAAPALRKAIYRKGTPMYITVDTSLTGIRWVISQEDESGIRFPIRFGAKVLSERQRGYAQVKRKLRGVISAVKVGTEVIIDTDCLPILGMVSGCATPNLALLRWIVYIKSLNPEIRHISEKDNTMADMLSRARFEATYVTTRRGSTPALNEFDESKYDGEWLQIGGFLRTMTLDAAWTKEETNRIRKKAYQFFLRDWYIWKHPKKRDDIPLRVVAKKEEQEELLAAYHESPWAGHRGTWATFEKIKGKYWCPGLYRDVHRFVTTCESCQMHSVVRHRDELHPTYPPTIHFKWMVHLESSSRSPLRTIRRRMERWNADTDRSSRR